MRPTPSISHMLILMLGNTHQANFRTLLLRLARLQYVRRIEQAYFE